MPDIVFQAISGVIKKENFKHVITYPNSTNEALTTAPELGEN